jgi:hypothetical protein
VLREQPALEDFVTLRWNGHDTSERPVPAGVYFMRIQAGDSRSVQKVVILR